jgi:hypothetical protein
LEPPVESSASTLQVGAPPRLPDIFDPGEDAHSSGVGHLDGVELKVKPSTDHTPQGTPARSGLLFPKLWSRDEYPGQAADLN